MTTLVAKSEFAAIYGCSRAYVSQLVAAKRIVLAADGKRVDVEASLELLGVTADPSKAGVRERWAAFRADRQAPATAPAAAPAPVADPAPAAAQASLIDQVAAAPTPAAAAAPAAPTARSEYHDARTVREKAEAEMAQIELMKLRGQVLDADSTLRAVTTAHRTVCGEVLGLADRLTPLVLGQTDKRKVWELINAECERLCKRLQDSATKLAQQTAEVTA